MSQNNPPFQIGQKVVCVNDGRHKYQDPNRNQNEYIKKGNVYTIKSCFDKTGDWMCTLLEVNLGSWFDGYFCYRFAPIQSNYSDATAEILEKFKSPAETPDKVIVPEKVTNHL